MCTTPNAAAPMPAAATATRRAPFIETDRYVRSHMKEPRGRGAWMFEDRDGNVLFEHNGLYTEARAKASDYAKAHRLPGLYTCP